MRLRHRCFPVNFAKFVRTRFYRTPPNDCFLKWCKIHKKAPATDSLFNKVAGWKLLTLLKTDPGTGVFQWNREIFKNTFFTEHEQMTASGLQSSSCFNPFFPSVIFLTPLKISENLWFTDVFRVIERDHWHEMG